MFSDADLTAAASRAHETLGRAAELGISPDLLAQMEHLGGTADDAKRLFDAAVAANVPLTLLALHAIQITSGLEAPPTAAAIG